MAKSTPRPYQIWRSHPVRGRQFYSSTPYHAHRDTRLSELNALADGWTYFPIDRNPEPE